MFMGSIAGENGWFVTCMGFFLSPPSLGFSWYSRMPETETQIFPGSILTSAYFIPFISEIRLAKIAGGPPALPPKIVSRALFWLSFALLSKYAAPVQLPFQKL